MNKDELLKQINFYKAKIDYFKKNIGMFDNHAYYLIRELNRLIALYNS